MPESELYRKIRAEAAAQWRPAAPRPRAARAPVPAPTLPTPSGADLRERTLAELAHLIAADWPTPYFGAVPYLNGLAELGVVDPADAWCGADPGDSVVRYFLSNASTWRGPTARAVKAELRRRIA